MTVSVPQISSTELQSFYTSHFGPEATAHFQKGFLCPIGHENATLESEQDYDEDDGLGYYPDGVKRTLTDEQIAIFRHSEIETLRREHERHGDTLNYKSRARSLDPAGDMHPNNGPNNLKGASISDTSGPSTKPTIPSERASVKTEAEGLSKTKRTKKAKREPKPDLRKRTWDVVGKGLDSLDYDDM